MHVVLLAAAPLVAFDWAASALGAVAGFGLALALVGSIALSGASRGDRTRRRNR